MNLNCVCVKKHGCWEKTITLRYQLSPRCCSVRCSCRGAVLYLWDDGVFLCIWGERFPLELRVKGGCCGYARGKASCRCQNQFSTMLYSREVHRSMSRGKDRVKFDLHSLWKSCALASPVIAKGILQYVIQWLELKINVLRTCVSSCMMPKVLSASCLVCGLVSQLLFSSHGLFLAFISW